MAVKRVRVFENEEMRVSLLREISLLKGLKHDNIVQYYGSERDGNYINIFMEYVAGGSLSSIIKEFGKLSENVVRVYTKQVLLGLKYLHDNHIIHGDLKSGNVLIDGNGVAKITDFGCSERVKNDKNVSKTLGTVYWIPPELINSYTKGKFSDIWSLGCTIIHMLSGKHPWSNNKFKNADLMVALYHIGKTKSPPEFPSNISNDAITFLQKCLKLDFKKRASVDELLEENFVTKKLKVQEMKSLFNTKKQSNENESSSSDDDDDEFDSEFDYDDFTDDEDKQTDSNLVIQSLDRQVQRIKELQERKTKNELTNQKTSKEN